MSAFRIAESHPANKGIAFFIATIKKGAVIRVRHAEVYVFLFEVFHGVYLPPSVYHLPGNELFKHSFKIRV
jgi:hypothetical protein